MSFFFRPIVSELVQDNEAWMILGSYVPDVIFPKNVIKIENILSEKYLFELQKWEDDGGR